MDNNMEELEDKKKITGLKVTKYALTALSGVASLVTSPIMTGISVAAGLGSVLAEAFLDNKENTENLAPVK